MRIKIEQVFQISGRGAVAVIDQVTANPVGRTLCATVFCPDGSQMIVNKVFKEWVLSRHPKPFEKESYLLYGIDKSQIPEGSFIEVYVTPGG